MTCRYHEYKIISDYSDAMCEVCVRCGKRLITHKDAKTGRIDNRAYAKEHARDLLQPSNPDFHVEYAEFNRKQNEVSEQKRRDDEAERFEAEEEEKRIARKSEIHKSVF